MADQTLGDRLDAVIDALIARGDASGSLRDQQLAPLARVAADLRHYPNRDFTARLRAQLERRTNMTTAVGNPDEAGLHDGNPAEAGLHLREGFTTVTPYVWVPDRGFVDFLVRVFDAVETRVADNPGHGIHREMRIGSSMMMIGESGEPNRPSRPIALHVFVDDADATFAKAIAAGGTSIGDPADRPYGERSGFIRDPYGNSWYIATPLGPESLAHHLRSVTPYLLSRDVRGYIEFLVRAFGAVEEVVVGDGSDIPYARARIGNAAVEFGSADPMPGSYFLYVADPDAVYEQAVAAGAKALAPPADVPSGLRIGFVEDLLGNQWYIARPA